MADGKNNDKPVQNSLLSGASGGFSFDEFSNTTILPVVEPVPPVVTEERMEAETTEIDLTSDENNHAPRFSHFIPENMPQGASSVFQSPPTPSSVQLFTAEQGQFIRPTQAIDSPISSDSYSTVGNSSTRQNSMPSNYNLDTERANMPSENAEESGSTFDHIRTTLGSLVNSITSTYSSYMGTHPQDLENNPMNLQRTNTSTTAGTGNSEITNVVPSSYISDVHRRVPEPFGSLQTPPRVAGSSLDMPYKHPMMYSHQPTEPTWMMYPEAQATPTAPSAPNPPNPADNNARSPSPPNPAYVTAYSTVNELGSAYNFGPIPTNRRIEPQNPDEFSPVTCHWFYKKESEGRFTWEPFSLRDSEALELNFEAKCDDPVSTDGGRYDVFISERLRKAVYWDEDPSEVRRCSWFYKGPMDSRFIPYDEEFSGKVEEEYYKVFETKTWHTRFEFGEAEAIVFHNVHVIVHFCQAAAPDEWGNVPESQLRPRVVKRGIGDDFTIQDGESPQIDHLVFLVHGIGAICDFKFRCIDEAVNGFRNLAFTLMRTHFKEATTAGLAGRVEFLPVSWHKALHGDRGVDEQLKKLTLPSIPKLRHFTNDTLLDILFYTSPKYCQTIIKAVGNEMNKMYKLFIGRNKNFNGKVAVGGHSLGSLILFDLLSHQPVPSNSKNTVVDHVPSAESIPSPNSSTVNILSSSSTMENVNIQSSEQFIPQPGSTPRMVSFSLGSAGTGQPFIVYPVLAFKPTAFFAMGSPTAMFVTVRGLEKLGEDFRLPTCPAYFNIFHPFDPVAYRIEPLIAENFDPEPVMIQHHKGRKRLHLELKDTMIRVGLDIKTKIVDSVLYTIGSLTPFAKRVEPPVVETTSAPQETPPPVVKLTEKERMASCLNKGRRIDYVLQEAPVESINEYLFALSSHVCYWESEDTMLLILKEIYNTLGVREDSIYSTSFAQETVQGAEPDASDIGPAAKVLLKEQCCSDEDQLPSTSAALRENLYGTSSSQTIPLVTDLTNRLNNLIQTQPSSGPTPPQSTDPCYPSTAPYFDNNVHATLSAPLIVQQTSSPPRSASTTNAFTMGMDPTAPPSNTTIGPPPLAGFQRRT